MDEFTQASQLEREKFIEFIPYFTNDKIDFKYQFSDSNGYENYDLLMKINNTPVVAEIKVRYKHYNGWYLEQQKYNSLKEKFPDKILFYFCITISGVYVYNLNKIDFATIRLSKEWLPKTSAKKSRLIKKSVFTLPTNKPFCKYYPIFLV